MTRLVNALHRHMKSNGCFLKPATADECLHEFYRHGSFYYYRGMPNARFHLKTSLDRALEGKRPHDHARRERMFLDEFRRVAHNHLPAGSLPSTTFGWLSLMQHYGVPTRLLDLTRSPYVALYFAVRDWNTACDAAVWAINPSGLHDAARHRLREKSFPLPLRDEHEYLLRDFVADEYFINAFFGSRYGIAAVLEPTWADRRMANQQGAFLISDAMPGGLEDTLADLLISRPDQDEREKEMLRRNARDWSVVKIVVRQSLKKELFMRLTSMNVHAGTLFPDLYGEALRIKEWVCAEEFVLERWGLLRDYEPS